MQTTAKKCNHGANIRRWREWRNVNQDVLAEEIGVSQATLSGYEKKENYTTRKTPYMSEC